MHLCNITYDCYKQRGRSYAAGKNWQARDTRDPNGKTAIFLLQAADKQHRSIARNHNKPTLINDADYANVCGSKQTPKFVLGFT